MVIVKPIKDFPALQIRGKFSQQIGLGSFLLGFNELGTAGDLTGIYRKLPRKQGFIIVKSKLYRPRNPRTTAQQAWRNVFANGMSAYALLTPDEKRAYTIKGYKFNLPAHAMFLKEYLNSQ